MTLGVPTHPLPAADAPVHAVFAHWARATPDAPAVIDAGTTHTYRSIWQRGCRVAESLREHGAVAGAAVATLLPRSAEQVVALLGGWQAGCAVLPLEPGMPKERIATVLADAGVRLVLTDRAVDGDRTSLPVPATGSDWADPTPVPFAAPACVLYTSGSTGHPKGVLLGHQALVRYARRQAEFIGMTSVDRVAQRAPYSTDAALLELIFAFAVGAATVVVPPDTLALPESFVAAVVRDRISVLTIVPSLLRTLLADGVLPRCPTLRAITSFGEQLTTPVARELAGQTSAALFNLYGPTEVGVGCAGYRVNGAESGPAVPIGPVTDDVRSYVCADDGSLVPDGEPGELYVGGDQLAHGYLNRAAVTAERFVPDRYSGIPGARLYRTGDLVVRGPDGALTYLGRQDDQLKLRGVRVEPGEIEAAIQQHPGVRQAVVVPVPGADGAPLLVAFVIGSLPDPELRDSIRARLRAQLPAPLIPSVFHFPPALPLLVNGKADRRRLATLATSTELEAA